MSIAQCFLMGFIMSIASQNQAGCDVIGISARTTNKAEFDGNGIIAGLWQRFFAEQVYAKVPNRADNNIMALYCEYACDKDDAYTIVLGVRVTHVDEIPAGMQVYHVPAQQYVVFTTPKGQIPNIVVDTWQKIWAQENAGTLKRAYLTDYELYDERSSDPQNAQVDIYIGI
jgi:predicted transcriptional regulator YdeE